MIGVTVRLDSTSIGTATAVDGAFTLVVDKPKGNLVFSFIGFKAKKVAITPDKDMIVKLARRGFRLGSSDRYCLRVEKETGVDNFRVVDQGG